MAKNIMGSKSNRKMDIFRLGKANHFRAVGLAVPVAVIAILMSHVVWAGPKEVADPIEVINADSASLDATVGGALSAAILAPDLRAVWQRPRRGRGVRLDTDNPE